MSSISLKRIDRSNINDLIVILKDKKVKETYMIKDYETEEEFIKLSERLISYSHDLSHYVRGIFVNDLLIGFINDVEIVNKDIELGYCLNSSYWNRGYGTNALKLAIDEVFNLGYYKVITAAFETNMASIKVMVNNKMKLLDKIEYIYYRGKEHKCVYYYICNEKEKR